MTWAAVVASTAPWAARNRPSAVRMRNRSWSRPSSARYHPRYRSVRAPAKCIRKHKSLVFRWSRPIKLVRLSTFASHAGRRRGNRPTRRSATDLVDRSVGHPWRSWVLFRPLNQLLQRCATKFPGTANGKVLEGLAELKDMREFTYAIDRLACPGCGLTC